MELIKAVWSEGTKTIKDVSDGLKKINPMTYVDRAFMEILHRA